MVEVNPFYLDLTLNAGVFILACMIGLAIWLFYRKAFTASGALCMFMFFVLLYNDISFMIAGIPFIIGILMLVGGKNV